MVGKAVGTMPVGIGVAVGTMTMGIVVGTTHMSLGGGTMPMCCGVGTMPGGNIAIARARLAPTCAWISVQCTNRDAEAMSECFSYASPRMLDATARSSIAPS